MSFLYSIFLKLLYPTSLCVGLLLASAVFRRRHSRSALPAPRSHLLDRLCFWLAVAVLMVCGNGWVVRGLTQHLEWQNLPRDPVPVADCIVVLGGGLAAKIPPRTTVEVTDAGDRVLYAAHLYRQGKAPQVICIGGIATGGVALRSEAEEMQELLELLGVPPAAITKETDSGNTHENGRNVRALLPERGFKRVLLVTSALHMPRTLGVFRKYCTGIEFIPAPTDFRITERLPAPWYQELKALVPTPANLLLFTETLHEYLGLAYYRLRGWL